MKPLVSCVLLVHNVQRVFNEDNECISLSIQACWKWNFRYFNCIYSCPSLHSTHLKFLASRTRTRRCFNVMLCSTIRINCLYHPLLFGFHPQNYAISCLNSHRMERCFSDRIQISRSNIILWRTMKEPIAHPLGSLCLLCPLQNRLHSQTVIHILNSHFTTSSHSTVILSWFI